MIIDAILSCPLQIHPKSGHGKMFTVVDKDENDRSNRNYQSVLTPLSPNSPVRKLKNNRLLQASWNCEDITRYAKAINEHKLEPTIKLTKNW